MVKIQAKAMQHPEGELVKIISFLHLRYDSTMIGGILKIVQEISVSVLMRLCD